MIDLPSKREDRELNPFESVITADVVQQILMKQVEKAQAGNTAAASLILKIAAAAAGQNQAPRTNPDTPVRSRLSVGVVASQLRGGPLDAHQLAARLSCDPEEVRIVLENSDRFAMSSRGQWSIATVPA